VIDRPRQHAAQLGLPDAKLDGVDLALELGQHRLVVVAGRELEQLARVGEISRQLLDRADLLFDFRALAQDFLRLGGVVPEVRIAGLCVELF
jgi:hypothetical protein